MTTEPPVILLAYANDKRATTQGAYLSHLAIEAEKTRIALMAAEKRGLCKVEIVQNATMNAIDAVFDHYGDRLAIFHYAGHSDQFDLLLESRTEGNNKVDHQAFARYLAARKSLRLVFLNSCLSYHHLPAYRSEKIPALIYTNSFIPDEEACDFAVQYYRSLGAGETLAAAYQSASNFIAANSGKRIDNHFRDLRSRSNPINPEGPLWDKFFHSEHHQPGEWNLPDAANQRLHLLPPIPVNISYPGNPYQGLRPYERNDARVYWGRENELLQLHGLLSEGSLTNVLLLAGAAGTGKTSLVQAGLSPRLESTYEVLSYPDLIVSDFIFSDPEEATTLDLLHTDPKMTSEILMGISANIEKPWLIVIDHIESGLMENEQFETNIKNLGKLATMEFSGGFQIKLIIVARNENLPELELTLDKGYVGYTNVYLSSPSEDDLTKFINGIAKTGHLQNQYGVTIQKGLDFQIIQDIKSNEDSNVLPLLQVLMLRLYEQAKVDNLPIDLVLYRKIDLKDLIKDHVQTQVDNVYNEDRYSELKNTGLVENVLGEYADPFGMIIPRTEEEVIEIFPRDIQDKVKELIVFFRDEARLLTDFNTLSLNEERADILIHEEVGRVVKRIQAESQKSGNATIRALNRIKRIDDILSPAVMSEIQEGILFAPVPNSLQETVISASMEKIRLEEKSLRWKRNRNRIRNLIIAGLGSIFLFPGPDIINSYGAIYLIVLLLLYRSG